MIQTTSADQTAVLGSSEFGRNHDEIQPKHPVWRELELPSAVRATAREESRTQMGCTLSKSVSFAREIARVGWIPG